jgi:catechol 2,3-dioxygenase-like lactoylglutathione lyase family enzyme
MGIEINGMAHVILTVSDFPAAREFYGKLLSLMGMTAVCDTDKFFYCVGGRTAIGIEPCAPEYRNERFVQSRVGLHHLCLRARSREDVDACAAALKDMGATIIRGPLEGTWAPGYYYVLFEDPDGIRLEINYVPGAGKWRSPEVWRKTAGESEFWVSVGVPKCRALCAKARVYWGFFRPGEPAENIWRGLTGGGRGIRNRGTAACGCRLITWLASTRIVFGKGGSQPTW